MNKARARLAVGINEIHPLLIVPSQPKGLAEGKGHTAETGDKETFYCEFTKNAFSVLSYKAASS